MKWQKYVASILLTMFFFVFCILINKGNIEFTILTLLGLIMVTLLFWFFHLSERLDSIEDELQ